MPVSMSDMTNQLFLQNAVRLGAPNCSLPYTATFQAQIMSYTKFSHSVCKKIAMFGIAPMNAQITAQLLETSWKSFCSAQEAQCQTPSVVAQQRW
jgi:hypothetical protein